MLQNVQKHHCVFHDIFLILIYSSVPPYVSTQVLFLVTYTDIITSFFPFNLYESDAKYPCCFWFKVCSFFDNKLFLTIDLSSFYDFLFVNERYKTALMLSSVLILFKTKYSSFEFPTFSRTSIFFSISKFMLRLQNGQL